MSCSTALRNALANNRVSRLGAAAQVQLWNGARPGALGSPAGTLLGTLVLGSDALAANGGAAGNVTNGVLTFGGVTQTNANHVGGTPTFARFRTSGGTAEFDIDIGAGAGNLQFTGAVVTGQNVTWSGVTITEGNP